MCYKYHIVDLYYTAENFSNYDNLFPPKQFSRIDNPDQADFLIFTGGADVHPDFYGDKPISSQLPSFFNRKRDEFEAEIFNKYVREKLLFGLCRGSQFLTAMSGGKLIQDVNGHSGNHSTEIVKKGKELLNKRQDICEIISVTSTHHQMMYPFNLPENDYDILAVAFPKKSLYYSRDTNNIESPPPEEVEAVYYKKTNAFAVQFHPEFNSATKGCVNFTRNMIKKLLDNASRNNF